MNAALAQDPFRPNAYLILSWIPVRRGDLEAAESAARRALEIQPTIVSMHYYLGVILLERGERDAALTEMQSETIE